MVSTTEKSVAGGQPSGSTAVLFAAYSSNGNLQGPILVGVPDMTMEYTHIYRETTDSDTLDVTIVGHCNKIIIAAISR